SIRIFRYGNHSADAKVMANHRPLSAAFKLLKQEMHCDQQKVLSNLSLLKRPRGGVVLMGSTPLTCGYAGSCMGLPAVLVGDCAALTCGYDVVLVGLGATCMFGVCWAVVRSSVRPLLV